MGDIDSAEIIHVSDLLSKKSADETDVFILEDGENTKKISFADLRASMIKDKETIGANRLWSSEKISAELEKVSKETDEKIGNITIDNTTENAVTEDMLNKELAAMDKKKCDVELVQAMSDVLEGKRNSTDPFTFNDIKPTTESEKLHLELLGEDVLSAMTGNTPVNPAVVPTGKWKTDDLADGIITAVKLASSYRFKKVVTDGNINLLIDDGLYLCGANVVGVPKYNDDEDDIKLLEVSRYGEDGKYIMQRVYYIDQPDPTVKRPQRFERLGETSKIYKSEFIAHFEVTESSRVESPLLGATYNDRGIVSTGMISDLSDAGNYYCTSGVSGLPIDGTDFLVSVNSYTNYIEYIAKTVDISSGGSKQFVRFLYYDSSGLPIITNWFQTLTDMKSKFGTKSVHIFGDGIAYGIGASDIGTTSFAGFLNSKYGYEICNHSLIDATFGVYGNDNMKERCVRTQIELDPTIASAEYAIIFAGTNDYSCGAAELGTNTSTSDITFKGAIVDTVKKLIELNPTCKILLVSPIYRASISAGDGHNGDDTTINGKILPDYVQAMKEISEVLHVPYVDIYSLGTLNKYNKDTYLNTDGIHPVDAGYELICEKIHGAMCQFY